MPVLRAYLVGLLCVWAILVPKFHAHGQKGPTEATFQSQGHRVRYEVYGATSAPATLIFLHGASGPESPYYRQQAQFFADHGYCVLYLHYFDATGSVHPSEANYVAWVQAVFDLIKDLHTHPEGCRGRVGLIGLSLGSSVALAAGSQGAPVDAIADWYGSLPDTFFYHFQSMPPLLILHGKQDETIPVVNAQQLQRLCQLKHLTCESHLYPGQSHGFDAGAIADAQAKTLKLFAKYLSPTSTH